MADQGFDVLQDGERGFDRFVRVRALHLFAESRDCGELRFLELLASGLDECRLPGGVRFETSAKGFSVRAF